MVPIANHVEAALARLLEQYKNQPLIAGLLTAFVGEVQVVEDAIAGMIPDEVLATATGAQLDGYGSIVGQPRNGMPDDQYRIYIQVRQLVDRSSGTPDEILAIFALLTAGLGATLLLREYQPAAFILQIVGAPVTTPADFTAILQQAKDAGVAAQLEWQGAPDATTFTFAGGVGLGFDTLNNIDSGGNFAEVTE